MKFTALSLLAALGLGLSSCVAPVAETGPGYTAVGVGVGVYPSLPVDYEGDYYLHEGRYYYGGRYEHGAYLYHGHHYSTRYFHSGHYYYGGKFAHAERHHH